METIKAVCEDKKTFRLTVDEQFIGTLTYLKWHSYNAEIDIAQDHYKLYTKGLFSSHIIIEKSHIEIGHMTLHYDGTVSYAIGNDDVYKLKIKGLLFNKCAIENAQKEVVFEIYPKFNWKNFSYDYTINSANEAQPLLALLGIYAAGYYISVFTIYLSLFVILLI